MASAGEHPGTSGFTRTSVTGSVTGAVPVTSTDQLIMDMTEQECRAVLLILASGTRGRNVADATVTEISAVLAETRA